ncbi:hypothetical protein WMF11_42890 [Sorangium sp. So ce295]|uniref:hypothetical protein n=1 Tax=Sorangium sp. So ce295 TaxID=3133295 RepID=UPI003F638D6A
MTGMLRDGLWIGCAAAAVLTVAPASAMQPASGASPAPAAPPSGPAAAPPAPAPGGAAAAPLQPPTAPGDEGAPPAGVAPTGAPQAPARWTTSPGPWQPGSAPGRERSEPKRSWYGWQHLLVLSGTVVLWPLAATTENEVFGLMAAGSVALGGPVTHWANGHLGMGFVSLGLNAGCTLGGGLIGAAIGSASDASDWGGLAGLFIGGGLGLITANIIDVALLEYEEQPTAAETYEYIRLRPPRLRLAPHVALAQGGTTFGLRGAF